MQHVKRKTWLKETIWKSDSDGKLPLKRIVKKLGSEPWTGCSQLWALVTTEGMDSCQSGEFVA
jgi:hypothetical protein